VGFENEKKGDGRIAEATEFAVNEKHALIQPCRETTSRLRRLRKSRRSMSDSGVREKIWIAVDRKKGVPPRKEKWRNRKYIRKELRWRS